MKQFIRFLFFFSTFFVSSIFSSCESDTHNDCVPRVNVSLTLNTNLPEYSVLNSPGRWIYVGGEGAGTRGLIIVSIGNDRYKAWDRNAPHLCPDVNTTLEVVDGIKIVCPKDGAEWNINTGQPIKIANRPPMEYNAFRSGNTLVVTR
ncbi:hypothetical protein [Weeksella virosa]|uniref:Rieske domain-containing protein n=1 Tax=Weeksella virosa (strain ATCC 43766 / DSM 16922 / JCM 21250 / CCUG 30538 / CDC 9751 / IAM 14551 / NBRC 16016 / NCTC 11634 / CL345/78) TaxID=865938 RepID=F0NYT1_WEEVC|nr:hypothetical protein [Weeksella virosa]ADX68212.1 hypothetical protein Weevi_1512 [Weeksella virosa DSM 16922]VEH64151.1 Uncharacterised protein [Weeksella virosa]